MIERVTISPRRPSATPSWMVSLADLLALMLTFFVLMFSMNAVQLSTWQAVVTSFRKQFNPHAAEVIPNPISEADSVLQYSPWAVSLEYLSALLSHQVTVTGMAWANVIRLPDRVVISLSVDGAFNAETARLTPEAKVAIDDLVEQFSRIGNEIVISGHMNSEKNTGRAYQSNWELSLRRAEEVASVFRAAGYRRHIKVMGYGSGRSQELGQMASGLKFLTPGRRVDIEIMAWSAEISNAR